MPKVLMIKYNLAWIFHGPCKHYSVQFCVWTQSFMMHGMTHGITLTVISFGYRLFVIKHPSPCKKKLWLIIVLCSAVYLGFITTFGCISVVSMRRKAHLILQRADTSLSPLTKRVHRTLMKALAMQASLPFILYFSDMVFSSMLLLQIRSSVLENAICLFSMFPPALSPIMSIYYVQPYRILLINVAITDLICSASLGGVMTRPVLIHDSLGCVFHGPCKYIGSEFCFFAQSLMLHSMTHCIILTIISFKYRIFVLKNPSPSRKTIWLFIVFGYIPSFVMVCTFFYARETDSGKIETLKQLRSDVEWNKVAHVIIKSFFTIPTAIIAGFLGFLTTVGCFAVIVMRREAQSILKKADISLSPVTKRVHRTLMKALAMQASLPFLMYISDQSVSFMYVFQMHSSAVENYILMPSMLPPVFSPILSMYYVQPYRPEMDVFDEISWFSHTVAAVMGIAFNCTFILLICTRTTRLLKPYWIILFNVALTDLISSASLGFAMTRMVVIGDNLAYIFHGPCKYFGPETCFLGHAIMLHTLVHCVALTIISFGFRLCVLGHPSPSSRTLWLIVVLAYLPSFVMFWTLFTTVETDPNVVESLMKQKDDIPWAKVSHAFLISVSTPNHGGCCLYSFIMTTVGGFSVIFLRRKAHLILQKAELSTTTKKVHKTLMKALAMQASLPFLIYFADIVFTIMCLFQIHSSLIENSIFLLSMFPPALSPVMSIYYVNPYRIHSELAPATYPSCVKSRIILLNVAVTDLICTLAMGLAMSRLLMIAENTAAIFHGPCKYFGPKFCLLGHTIMLHGNIHCIMLTIISFGYRLFVLKYPSPRKRMLCLIVALGYLPSFVEFCTLQFTLEPDTVLIESLKQKREEIDWSRTSFVFFASVNQIANGGCSIYMFFMTTIGVVSVIIMRRKAHLILKNADSSLSPTTKRVHKTLMKALAMQASLPFLMFISYMVFSSMETFHLHYSVVENSIFLLSMCPPAFSPILSIYYVHPYRVGLQEWMKRCIDLSLRPNKSKGVITVTTSTPKFSIATSDAWDSATI
ncbi:unnamed protein product [Caenorhabditis auriculariae]|uniref:G-protein coupled receptors family 1 profile domain-containing protein n=1 Tax=Caenorhabditis auriculariae TaxID=2777116 RepID=A0A8S1HV89_9PELO|nr:unnamed protein product [Caenorhabditis auriculariae]